MLRPTISPVEHCKYSDFCSMQRSFSEYYFFKYKAFGAFPGGKRRKNEEELILSSFLPNNSVISPQNFFQISPSE